MHKLIKTLLLRENVDSSNDGLLNVGSPKDMEKYPAGLGRVKHGPQG